MECNLPGLTPEERKATIATLLDLYQKSNGKPEGLPAYGLLRGKRVRLNQRFLDSVSDADLVEVTVERNGVAVGVFEKKKAEPSRKAESPWWESLQPVSFRKEENERDTVASVLDYIAHHLDRYQRGDDMVDVGRVLSALVLAIRRNEVKELDQQVVAPCSRYIEKLGGMTSNEEVKFWSDGSTDPRAAQLRAYLCLDKVDTVSALILAAEHLISRYPGQPGAIASFIRLETSTALDQMGVKHQEVNAARFVSYLKSRTSITATGVVREALRSAGLTPIEIRKMIDAHRARVRRGTK